MLVFQQLADKIPESSTIGSLKPIRSRCCSSTWRVSFQCSWTRGPQKSLRGKRLILEISRSYVACLEKERGRGVPLCRGSPAAPHPQAWRVPPHPGVAVGQMLGENHRPPSDSACTCFPGGSRRLLWRKTFSYFKCLSLQHLSAQRD